MSSQESPLRTDLKQEKLTDNGNYCVWQTVLTSQPYHTIYKNFIFPQSLFRAGCTVNQLSGCTTQGKNSPFAPLFDVSESSPSFHQVLLPPQEKKNPPFYRKDWWKRVLWRTKFLLHAWLCAFVRVGVCMCARVRACIGVCGCVCCGRTAYAYSHCTRK